MLNFLKYTEAQATVEAAVMIPIIFLVLLLLIQPGIYLYDFCVMNEAASETCRVLLTANDVDKYSICQSFARRRLESIPQQDNFHVHNSGCSYEILLEGDQNSSEVKVSINNQLKPLPFIGFLSSIFGLLNDNNCFEIKVVSSQPTRPSWVNSSPQTSEPEKWVGGWLS